MVDIDLSGKVTVVTGASSGIGARTAEVLAECGASVVAVGRNPDRLSRLREHIETADEGSVTTVCADLRQPDSFDAILDAAGPKIDAMLFAAGHFSNAPLEDTDRDEMAALWEVHVQSPLLLLREARGRLTEGSSVIFYSSTVARVGFAPYAAYTAVKGAIEAVSRSLAIELAPRVRVNTVVPGFTATPMMVEQFPEAPELEAGIVARTPHGEMAGPDSAAHLAAFLISDLGPYIVGASVVADGGWTAQGWQQP